MPEIILGTLFESVSSVREFNLSHKYLKCFFKNTIFFRKTVSHVTDENSSSFLTIFVADSFCI